jgi:hypothetical protein
MATPSQSTKKLLLRENKRIKTVEKTHVENLTRQIGVKPIRKTP